MVIPVVVEEVAIEVVIVVEVVVVVMEEEEVVVVDGILDRDRIAGRQREGGGQTRCRCHWHSRDNNRAVGGSQHG